MQSILTELDNDTHGAIMALLQKKSNTEEAGASFSDMDLEAGASQKSAVHTGVCTNVQINVCKRKHACVIVHGCLFEIEGYGGVGAAMVLFKLYLRVLFRLCLCDSYFSSLEVMKRVWVWVWVWVFFFCVGVGVAHWCWFFAWVRVSCVFFVHIFHMGLNLGHMFRHLVNLKV